MASAAAAISATSSVPRGRRERDTLKSFEWMNVAVDDDADRREPVRSSSASPETSPCRGRRGRARISAAQLGYHTVPGAQIPVSRRVASRGDLASWERLVGVKTHVTDDADRIKAVGRRAEVESGRHQPSAPGPHLPPGSNSPFPAPRVPLSWDVGSSVFDTATIAGLRANLHELAADVHELAAAVHDLRAEEHAQALLHSLGDPGPHQLWADLRRTAAAAEWASARKERNAAEQLRRSPAL